MQTRKAGLPPKLHTGWKTSLNQILKTHNKSDASGGKAVSYATQDARREILDKGFKRLRELGFKLDDVRGFKERHLQALAKDWESRGLSASTIQNQISVFRVFGEWIGKKGMIRRSECYVTKPESVKRHLVTNVDKSWSGQQQKLEDKLGDIVGLDPYVAIQLELQLAFGLRVKEASLLKPRMADKSSYLAVNWGTKGGRNRVVPIQNAYQRDVLDRAKAMVANLQSAMFPQDYNFKEWRNHYYYVCQKSGISRKDGVTSHGLRHERCNQVYQEVSGHLSPIKGGNPHGLDPQLDKAARQEVAEIAGHSRHSIAGAYVGAVRKKK